MGEKCPYSVGVKAWDARPPTSLSSPAFTTCKAGYVHVAPRERGKMSARGGESSRAQRVSFCRNSSAGNYEYLESYLFERWPFMGAQGYREVTYLQMSVLGVRVTR